MVLGASVGDLEGDLDGLEVGFAVVGLSLGELVDGLDVGWAVVGEVLGLFVG